MLGFWCGGLILGLLYLWAEPANLFDITKQKSLTFTAFLLLVPSLLGIVLAFLDKFIVKVNLKDALLVEGRACWSLLFFMVLIVPGVKEMPLIAPVSLFLGTFFYFTVKFYFLEKKTEDLLADNSQIMLLVLIFLASLFVFFQTCIYHDALWTYGYLRSAVLDRDVSFYNEFMLFNSYYMYVPHPNEPVFYTGTCLFILPFFLVGHFAATLLSYSPSVFVDGYSWPYTVASGLAGVSAGLVALLLIYTICRKFFDLFPSLMASILIFWGGNLFFFTFLWPLYSHSFSVMMISFFLLFWIKTENDRSSLEWFFWGVILGLAAWIRPQNVLFGFLALCDLAVDLKRSGKIKLKPFLQVTFFGFGILLALLPQMLIWLKTSGHFWVDAYATIGDTFNWLHPRICYLLFSWNKGLFTWHPVTLLVIPGFVLLSREYPKFAWPLLGTFLLQLYLVGCYEFPEGGAGFGSRYLINSMPFIALCVAVVIDSLQKIAPKWVIVGAAMLLIYCNLSLVVMYQMEMIPHNNYLPNFRELIRLVFISSPQALKDFFFSVHINENFFVRSSLGAISCHAWKDLSALFGFFLLCAVCLALVAKTALKLGSFGSTKPLALLVILFILVDWAILSLRTGQVYSHVYPVLKVAYDRQEGPASLDVREFCIDAEEREKSISIGYNHVINFIDVTSTLVDGLDLPLNRVLARMIVVEDCGKEHAFDIVNGRDTAEYSTFSGKIDHAGQHPEVQKSRVVHHWLQRSEGGSYFYGAGFFQRYQFTHRLRVKQIRFEYLASRGKLIVTGINLVGS